ncbi:MAG: AAA family ATPase [Parvibaculum sp.]
MSSLLIRHLAFLGPKRPHASVTFEPGLNVICGASETGKSFIVDTIDFMLGGGDTPRDVLERAGYDRVRLLVESHGWPPLGLERSIEGGNFSAYEEQLFDEAPKTEPTVLREKHSAARTDTLSHALLERLDLEEMLLRRNKAGATRTLSFRDLARLAVVNEQEIQRRASPFLSGQFVQSTPEYAAFKLLVTGTDDSALVGTRETKVRLESVSGKIDLLDQMILELQEEIDESGLDRNELNEQLVKLEETIDEQRSSLTEVQGALDGLIEKRGEFAQEIQKRRARLQEISELSGRFGLLDEHYQIDLKRLEAIHESGSFFVHLDRSACPLCGAAPTSQHLDQDCDGNTEQVVLASGVEMEKIRQLRRELSETLEALAKEAEGIEAALPEFVQKYQDAEGALVKVASPNVSAERATFDELISKRAEVRAALEYFARLDRLIKQKEELESQDDDGGDQSESRTTIPTATLDEFSQTVERILGEWHYPNATRVFFDEKTKDFQIAGKPRGSSGKGLRAITHAAVSVGLLEFCLEHDLPHPGFLVLDSPLLAYWKPEGDEDDLSGTDLKEKFYEYLLGLKAKAQIIIIENEHPPAFVEKSGNVIVFTKNPHQGRYGLFPHGG